MKKNKVFVVGMAVFLIGAGAVFAQTGDTDQLGIGVQYDFDVGNYYAMGFSASLKLPDLPVWWTANARFYPFGETDLAWSAGLSGDYYFFGFEGDFLMHFSLGAGGFFDIGIGINDAEVFDIGVELAVGTSFRLSFFELYIQMKPGIGIALGKDGPATLDGAGFYWNVITSSGVRLWL